jgi:predicted O-methyltransferase YrrM
VEISKKTNEYMARFFPPEDELIKDMQIYAQEHHIPIMDEEGIYTMLMILEINQTEKILEIGTAIGYSAIRMLEFLPGSAVISLERDLSRAATAREYIQKAGMENRFQLIEGDALDVFAEVEASAPYDVLFIDAAKGQYEKFFQLYEPLVKEGGLIVSDNVLFKGFVTGENKPESRRMKKMVDRIHDFNTSLMNHPRFHTFLLPAGDGLLVSRKQKHAVSSGR